MNTPRYSQIVPLERLAPAMYQDLLPLYHPRHRETIDRPLRTHCREGTLRHWRIYPKQHRVYLFRPCSTVPLAREHTNDEIYLLCRLGYWSVRLTIAQESGFMNEEDWLTYLNSDFRRTLFKCLRETRPHLQAKL